MGHGLIQVPRVIAQPYLESGALVEVLPAFRPAPLPISAVYPQNRHLSPQVRAFVDWSADLFARNPSVQASHQDMPHPAGKRIKALASIAA